MTALDTGLLPFTLGFAYREGHTTMFGDPAIPSEDGRLGARVGPITV
jgi:hypothetical protein